MIFIEQLLHICKYICSLIMKTQWAGSITIVLHKGNSLALDVVLHAFAKKKESSK